FVRELQPHYGHSVAMYRPVLNPVPAIFTAPPNTSASMDENGASARPARRECAPDALPVPREPRPGDPAIAGGRRCRPREAGPRGTGICGRAGARGPWRRAAAAAIW